MALNGSGWMNRCRMIGDREPGGDRLIILYFFSEIVRPDGPVRFEKLTHRETMRSLVLSRANTSPLTVSPLTCTASRTIALPDLFSSLHLLPPFDTTG